MGVMSLIEAWDLGISDFARQMPSSRQARRIWKLRKAQLLVKSRRKQFDDVSRCFNYRIM
jgi:hypothetical protein